jgi:hypothetical protein
VTVKVAAADRPPTSIAVTVVPELSLGTCIVHENVPELPDVSEPPVQLAIGTVSNTSEARAVDTENPAPATISSAPMGPRPGETVMAGVVTAKVPDAIWPPTSVATTVVPDVPVGTTNVHANKPVVPVVNDPIVQLGIVTWSNTSDVRESETENPFPAMVNVAPTGPCPGVTVIEGTVTVNVAVADLPPTSVAVTVVPEVPFGTLNVQENAPVL